MLINPDFLASLPPGWADADTVRRSAALRVEPTEPDIYLVDGGEEAHWVNLRDEDTPGCDCGDHLFRDRLCKHAIAALLHRRDPQVRLDAWRSMARAGGGFLLKADLPVLGLLQNGWYHDPERAAELFDRHPAQRRQLVARFLFMGGHTGRRLRAHFDLLCDHMTWEEATPQVGGRSDARFPADVDHVRRVVAEVRPLVVVAFGRVAQDGIRAAGFAGRVIETCHPAARLSTVNDDLHAAAETLRQVLGIGRMTSAPEGPEW